MEALCLGSDKRTGLRGLFATEDFEAGDYLAAVPFTATLLVDDSLNRTQYSSNLSGVDPDVLTGLHFLASFVGEDRWRLYIDTLPSIEDHNFDPTPDFWEKIEIRKLEIRNLIEESLRRKDAIARVAEAAGVSIARLQWATWVIRSRGFTTLKLHSSGDGDSSTFQSRTVLIPWMDFLNHDEDPNSSIEVLEVPDCYDESFFALQATKPISAGSQVTIAYDTGHETSLDLLSKYGFWTVGNPADQRLNWDAVDAQWTTALEEDKKALTSSELDSSRRTIISLRIHLKTLSE